MKAVRSGLLGLLLVALALTQAPADPRLPPNPHQPMNEKAACAGCHAYHKNAIEPHSFVVPIPEKCLECHSAEKLGRSHPIGVDPSRSPEHMEVPEYLPLEDGMVSCGTCHNPHMAHLSRTKAYLSQAVAFVQKEGRAEVSWYKTLFLWKSDPIKGFEPLCIACHKDF